MCQVRVAGHKALSAKDLYPMDRTYAILKPRFHIIQLTGRIAQEPVYRTLPGTDGKPHHRTAARRERHRLRRPRRRRLHRRGVLHHDREGRADDRHRLLLVAVAGRVEHQDLGERRSEARQAPRSSRATTSPFKETARARRRPPRAPPPRRPPPATGYARTATWPAPRRGLHRGHALCLAVEARRAALRTLTAANALPRSCRQPA
jgi:hypothetical protein